MMRYLERTYELRHIFCHETPTELRLEPAEATHCLEGSIGFVNLAEYVVDSLLWAVSPKSMSEDYDIAKDAFDAEMERMRASLSALQRVLPRTKRTALRTGQEAWTQYSKLAA
jgi:Skp family chaperone for outer membrane proteins